MSSLGGRSRLPRPASRDSWAVAGSRCAPGTSSLALSYNACLSAAASSSTPPNPNPGPAESSTMISSSWNIFMPEKTVSVIIPARNEEALISRVLDAVLRAAGNPSHLSETDTEVIVVDNASADDTLGIVRQYAARYGVQWIQCQQVRAPCARNRGAKSARGRVFVFVDADTVIPPHTLNRVRHLCDAGGYQAGITWYASLEGG